MSEQNKANVNERKQPETVGNAEQNNANANDQKHSKKAGRTVQERPLPPVGEKLDFAAVEAYNVLRTNLILSMPGKRGGRIIGVTSSYTKEGKSYNTANLSHFLAKDGYKTLLVSADMRKPTIERYFHIPQEPGLSNVLSAKAGIDECIKHACETCEEVDANLYVLPAGTIPPNPSELLNSVAMEDLLADLVEQYDYIMVDLPPVTSVIDPIAVSPLLDGMLVVVRHGYTHRRALVSTIRQLRFAGVHILGFLYNGQKKGGGGYYRNKYKSGGYSGYSDYYKKD